MPDSPFSQAVFGKKRPKIGKIKAKKPNFTFLATDTLAAAPHRVAVAGARVFRKMGCGVVTAILGRF